MSWRRKNWRGKGQVDGWTVIKGSIRGPKKVIHRSGLCQEEKLWYLGQYRAALGGGTGWALVILGQHRGEPICLYIIHKKWIFGGVSPITD